MQAPEPHMQPRREQGRSPAPSRSFVAPRDAVTASDSGPTCRRRGDSPTSGERQGLATRAHRRSHRRGRRLERRSSQRACASSRKSARAARMTKRHQAASCGSPIQRRGMAVRAPNVECRPANHQNGVISAVISGICETHRAKPPVGRPYKTVDLSAPPIPSASTRAMARSGN